MIKNRIRDRVAAPVPPEDKEAITFLQYEPGVSLSIHVSPGELIDETYRPFEHKPPEMYNLIGDELAGMMEDKVLEDAISTILQKCWDRIDARRNQIGVRNADR